MEQLIRIALLSAHLLAVNVAAGGPVICIWLEWRRGKVASEAIRFLTAGSLAGLFVGGLFGLSLGLLEWDREYATVWSVQLGNKVYFAIWELIFSAVLLGGYWFWRKRETAPKWQSGVRSFLLFVAATNLLYHFPALFFVGQRLIDQAGEATPLSSSDFRGEMFAGEVPALIMHFTLASVAVAGVYLMHLAFRWRRQGREDDAKQAAVWGARWALGATLLQLPVGLWTLVTLPRTMQNELLGSSMLGLTLFGMAMLTALWLTRELVSISMGETDRGLISRALLAMTITVVVMTASHDLARERRKGSVPASVNSQRQVDSSKQVDSSQLTVLGL